MVLVSNCIRIKDAASPNWFIRNVSQPELQIEYRGKILKQYFKPDFICFDKIIIEIKAVSNLVDAHRSQAINYLNSTNFELALLVNFGHYPKVEYERIGNRKNYRSLRDEIKSLTGIE